MIVETTDALLLKIAEGNDQVTGRGKYFLAKIPKHFPQDEIPKVEGKNHPKVMDRNPKVEDRNPKIEDKNIYPW